jgi:hypothetical protein
VPRFAPKFALKFALKLTLESFVPRATLRCSDESSVNAKAKIGPKAKLH